MYRPWENTIQPPGISIREPKRQKQKNKRKIKGEEYQALYLNILSKFSLNQQYLQ